MTEQSAEKIPRCPVCDEKAVEQGWKAVGGCFCENAACPIEEWDYTIEWSESNE